MKYLTFTFVIIILLSVSPDVFAVELDPALVEAMETSGFSTEQLQQVENMVSTARQQGLPTGAVVGKVYEGIAKQVAPDRIVQALERVSSRYQYSYQLASTLSKKTRERSRLGDTITAGMAAGLTRQDAEELVGELESRAAGMKQSDFYRLAEETMLTARDLCRQGTSSESTADLVGKAVRKDFSAKDMEAMRNSFGQYGAHRSRESLAKEYGAAMDQGLKGKDLEGHDRDAGSGGNGGGAAGAGGAGAGGDGAGGDANSGDSGSGDGSGNDGGGAGDSDRGQGRGGDSGGSDRGGGRH